MKGKSGIQMSMHQDFHGIFKDIKVDRIKKGKEKSGELSDKRLSLTLFKLLKHDKILYNTIVNAEIDKNEV